MNRLFVLSGWVLLFAACKGFETKDLIVRWTLSKPYIEEQLRQEWHALDADIETLSIATRKQHLNVVGLVLVMNDSFDHTQEVDIDHKAQESITRLRSFCIDSASITDMTFRMMQNGKEIYQKDFSFKP